MNGPGAAAGRSDRLLERLTGLHPKRIDLSLGRMERLLARLGHPERRLPPIVHVAGTNGKGSTVAYLGAIAAAAGLTAHAYTSPHLVRFHERIRLGPELVSEDHLAALLEECERANGAEPITFFEVTTAAAFLAFARVPADLLLLEVGLGGRLDATNVIPRPAACVITPVALDHAEFLGTAVAAVAAEKAGILKPDVPAVIAAQEPAALAVIEARAEALDAPLLLAGRDFAATPTAAGFRFTGFGETLELPPPALPGLHQIDNAGLAVAVARLLDWPVAALGPGLEAARWPARLQQLRHGPMVERAAAAGAELWLDGGHNPHAGAALAKALAALDDDRPLALIAGLLATKDAAGFFAPFRALDPPVVALAIPGEAASRPAAAVAAAARAAGLRATAAATLGAALDQALSLTGPAPRLLICGSLYLAGQVLRDHG